MSEKENEDSNPCKKFKPSQDEVEIHCGGHKESDEAEAGNYYLGPVVKKYVKAPVTQCLARKKGTDDYYLMKILVLDDSDSSDKCSLVRRMVFHNEYSFLSLLKNHFGVIQLCDFFKDYIYKETSDSNVKIKLKRICMVLECLIPHRHHNAELIPLNHYLKEERLSETEALYIFYNLLLVIEDLHNKNIVHRDLKLSNIILNRKTLKVKLMDFYYAKLLTSSNEVQYSQCRSSSNSLPDVLASHVVSPKTCDMWSAGVILYTMLNGSMPFANATNFRSSLSSSGSLRSLFFKFWGNDRISEIKPRISDGTKNLLKNILWRIPQSRPKASEALDMVSALLVLQCASQNPSLLDMFEENKSSDQVVPECPDFDSNTDLGQQEVTTPKKESTPDDSEMVLDSESDALSVKEKTEKTARVVEEEDDDDDENFPSPPVRPKLQDNLLNRKDIKHAMRRLGVTSLTSINALSFNYCKKRSCRS